MKMKIGLRLIGEVCVDVRAEGLAHDYVFVIFSLGQRPHFIGKEVEVGGGNGSLPGVTQSGAK